MRLSTRARYGLRALVEVARNHANGPLPLATIAGDQGLSRKYLHAILTALRSAGVVRSVRGTGGGYVLARDPAEIRLKEIFEALEGSLAPAECIEDPAVCERSVGCVTREVWRELGKAMEEYLSGITLEDLVRRGDRRDPPMFHI